MNNDPDGLECYSDHAHDIHTVHECTWCGSTEVDVIGHVLPDVERYKGVDPVKASAIVIKARGYKIFDGVLLDGFSAGAIQSVYNALSTDAAKDKLRAMTLVRAVDVCFRLINKENAK